jgi:hypothetical protein
MPVVADIIMALMVCCFAWVTNVVGRGADATSAKLYFASFISSFMLLSSKRMRFLLRQYDPTDSHLTRVERCQLTYRVS